MKRSNFISLSKGEQKYYVHNFLISSFTYVVYDSGLNCFILRRLHFSSYSIGKLSRLSALGLEINVVPENNFVVAYIYL